MALHGLLVVRPWMTTGRILPGVELGQGELVRRVILDKVSPS